MSPPRLPRDPTPYPRDPDSRPLDGSLPSGRYVFVRDVDGVVMHPKVLGHARPAEYAGDVEIVDGEVVEITNCSGTFGFDSQDGLWEVVDEFESFGYGIAEGAVVWWSPDGSASPRVLRRGG